MTIPICNCAEFWADHHPDCEVRHKLECLTAILSCLTLYEGAMPRVVMDTERLIPLIRAAALRKEE